MIRKLNLASLLAACAVVGLLAVAPQAAQAQIWDVDWAVAAGSKLQLKINGNYTISLSEKTANITVTGGLNSTVNEDASTLKINSADMSFSDFALNWNLIIAKLDLKGAGIKLGWESDPMAYTGNSGPNNLNIGGSTLAMNQGTLIATGSGLASGVNEAIDLGAEPVDFEAPDPTNTSLNITDLSVPSATWAIPISLDETISIPNDDGSEAGWIRVRLNGTINLVAVNSVLVPEPSSVMLAGFAAFGLCWAGRKRFRKAS